MSDGTYLNAPKNVFQSENVPKQSSTYDLLWVNKNVIRVITLSFGTLLYFIFHTCLSIRVSED